MDGLKRPLEIMITGKKIINEQHVRDILLKTDPGLTEPCDDSDCDTALKIYTRSSAIQQIITTHPPDHKQLLRQHLGCIVPLLCFENCWTYTPALEGPYGWCSEQGDILMNRDVYFPSNVCPIELFQTEAKLIAETFSFLDMVATLFNDSCKQDNTIPLVSCIINKGICKVIEQSSCTWQSPAHEEKSFDCSILLLHHRMRTRRELTVSEVLATVYVKDSMNILPCALSDSFLYETAKFVRDQWDKINVEK